MPADSTANSPGQVGPTFRLKWHLIVRLTLRVPTRHISRPAEVFPQWVRSSIAKPCRGGFASSARLARPVATPIDGAVCKPERSERLTLWR